MELLRNSNDIYGERATIEDFNNTLVKLFGNKADGLISVSDIEKVFFVEKNGDGTYHFMGFDGSESSADILLINTIEKNPNKNTYTVKTYEYKVESDSEPGNMEEEVNVLLDERIYDVDKKLITTLKIQTIEEKDENGLSSYTTKLLDENGNEIEDRDTYIIENFKDKLSTRQIELEYDSEKDLYYMINNHFTK